MRPEARYAVAALWCLAVAEVGCSRPVECGDVLVPDETGTSCRCPDGTTFEEGRGCVVMDEPIDPARALLGTWEGCNFMLTLEEGGTLEWASTRSACVASGSWVAEENGARADLRYSAECAGELGGATRRLSLGFLGMHSLAVNDPDTGAQTRAARVGTLPVQTWSAEVRLESGEQGTGVFRLVPDTREMTWVGCFWSESTFPLGDEGEIVSWTITGSTVLSQLGCGVECMCRGTLVGALAGTSTVQGDLQLLRSGCSPALTNGTITLQRMDEH